MEHGSFHIRCQSEDCTIAYVFREMLVTNTEVSGARVAGAVGDPGGHKLKAGAKLASIVGSGRPLLLGQSGFSPGEHFSRCARLPGKAPTSMFTAVYSQQPAGQTAQVSTDR